MQFTYRPLPTWPHPATPVAERRSRWTFKADWSDTLAKLRYEVERLDGRNVIFGVGLRPEDIRMDGLPRANARPLSHPGVELSFDSKFGRLTYATDAHESWQHNVRAIALSLEALRAVDRYGVSKRGEQYAGWAQLTAGPSQEDLGRELVERYGGIREAMRATHPDTRVAGATDRDFAAVIAYKQAGR